ncbi:MAG: Carboxypeptidase regulatory-like domain [Chlorobi bacterium]|nr:Carboxypeptidase regulatory-like domain [Chlorobiota bacterium]
MMILIALALALLAALIPILLASHATGSVAGRVTGALGETVLGAVVTISGNDTHHSSRAWGTGSYYIGDLSPGIYELLVTARGYHDIHCANVGVVDGQETHVDVMLIAAQGDAPRTRDCAPPGLEKVFRDHGG